MQCLRCGAPLVPGAPACGHCGLALAVQPPPPAWVPPPPVPPRGARTGLVVATVLAILLVAGGATAAALLWLPRDDSPPVTQTTVEPSPTVSPFADFSAVYADVHDGVGQVTVQTCDGTFSGTGFLVSPSLMATAAHVIENASSLQVELEGQLISAEVFGVDLSHDLALLELSEEAEGHVFAFATEDPEPGTRIAAIGFPLGEPKALTEGTVSGLDRQINTRSGSYDGLLQTDTAINPGNSGGPLVDISGRVVGVADAIRTDAQGIGFAVPATIARELTSTTLQTQELATC